MRAGTDRGDFRVLVVAKAPVPGQAKTRLAATLGPDRAAELAAAALLDTLDAAAAAAVTRPVLALAGDLAAAVQGARLRRALGGWHVVAQRDGTFAERLAGAHVDAASLGAEPVLQVGMDTPQLTAGLLADMADRLASADAVLGPARDGGWWLLGLHRPEPAALLRTVPMSTPQTGRATRRVLERSGLVVADGPLLRDVDVAEDAEAVARCCHPGSRFAAGWARIRSDGASAQP